ncbi:MFS transporter [Pseudonocardia endophytica]|uniref:MFS transporter n=1 Tax=Pseudonocardia endophytica TaxID=401976 RepID=A0A4V2PI09_PSEEN|nr:MFS transporter [Pseudonocardia endophytica]TCK22846.1 MFS transporter [Pseudonocardia endophytica]
MTSMLGSFRALSVPARLLVVNQFGINAGFYLVLPFLAVYLGSLGYAAATIGLVLALRNLSQQGLFLVGGSAADRIGPRPMIIAGCALRVVAFGLLGLVQSLPGIVAAAVLTGLAGAAFNPAVRTYLTHEAGPRRAEVFAVFNVFANAGMLVGPLLGAALLAVDFRLTALVACAVFAALTLAQLFALPARPVAPPERGVLGSWGEALANRRFLVFAAGGATYFVLYNQLYLALPIEARRVTGVEGAVAAVFVLSTVIGLLFQVRIVAWCRARWSAGRSMAAGLVVMGAGFVPLALAAPLSPTAPAGDWTPGAALAVVPVLVGTALFTVGMAVVDPFYMALLPVVGSERLAGTYYGLYYLVSAAAVAGTNPATGALLGWSGSAGVPWVPFAVLVAVGLAGAAVVATLERRGALDEHPARPGPQHGSSARRTTEAES